MLGQYLQSRPLVGGYLFINEDCSPLTIYQFSASVMQALGDMGFAAYDFSLHSLYIGAATVAAELGLAPKVIQRIRRWRSAGHKRYIRR